MFLVETNPLATVNGKSSNLLSRLRYQYCYSFFQLIIFFSGTCLIAAPVLHPKDPALMSYTFLSYFGYVINKHELRLTMELLNCNILLTPPFRTSLLAGKKLQSVCKYCFVNPTEGPFT